jgi:ABC-type glycerol-3-phosphate transport system substrate-binding protein
VLWLSDLVAKKLVRPLPRDLSAYPQVAATVERLGERLTYFDGEIYAFPRVAFTDRSLSSSDAGMLVRKDWLARLGLAPPESLEDFTQMAAAFARGDPDGNGQPDTLGYNSNNLLALGKWLILGIFPEANVYTWVERDGRFVPSFILPEFEPVVAAYRRLYETGGLDPDFYLKKATDVVYDFAHGNLGAMEYKSSPSAIAELEVYWDEFHGEEAPFDQSVTCLNIFPAPDGKRYSNSSTEYWSETLFSSRADPQKMDRILSIFDFLLSQEGWDLTRFGLEGVDYTRAGGEFQCLLDTSKPLAATLLDKYPSLALFTSVAAWGGTEHDFSVSPQNILRYGTYSTQLAWDALAWNRAGTVMLERPEEFLDMIKDESPLFSKAAMSDAFCDVVIGQGDPVALWRGVIDQWNHQGLEAYIDQLNRQAAAQGIFPGGILKGGEE